MDKCCAYPAAIAFVVVFLDYGKSSLFTVYSYERTRLSDRK